MSGDDQRKHSGVNRLISPSTASGRYAAISNPPISRPGGSSPSSPDGPISTAPRRASFTRASHGPLRVFLVSQENEARKGALRVLEKHGASIEACGSFGELFHKLENSTPGRTLVFLDPLLGGFEPRVVHMLRQHPAVSGGPIVLLSAISSQVLEDVGRATGADGFIVTARGLLHLDTALPSWLQRLDQAMASAG